MKYGVNEHGVSRIFIRPGKVKKLKYSVMQQFCEAKGVKFGRPEIPTPDSFERYISKWEKGQITTTEILTLTGLTKSTFYRKVREYNLIKKQ